MLKYIFILLMPIFLYANLNYVSNQNNEMSLLESFDIEPSFIYDPIMNDMKNKNITQHSNKRYFKAMEKAYLFVPAIKNILAKYKIPPEFIYLSMAESDFLNQAYSKKKAAGLWQFMPNTGKVYGLKIDEYVDERKDPIKSTEAAAKYLSFLHKRFGKWYLAAIAYNCGFGRLERVIKKIKTDDLSVLLDEDKKYLPKESRYYIRKIVALAMIGRDEQLMLKSEYEYLLNRANAYSLSTIRVSSGESLKRISKLIGLPIKELKNLNRHLKYDFAPPYGDKYDLYIPYIKLSEFKSKYKNSSSKSIYKIYRVRKGDNLGRIGKKFAVNYKVIMDFNHLKNTRLKIKQKLIIPILKRERVKAKYYSIKKGDTLHSISKIYKVSVADIKRQNNLQSSFLKIGNKLKIYE